MSIATPPPPSTTPATTNTPPASIMTPTTVSTTATPSTSTKSNTFEFPPHYSFPPFYTLQPNSTTRESQLASWSALLSSYCAHHRLYQLSPSHSIFANSRLRRTLAPDDARVVLQHMVTKGNASWVNPSRKVANEDSDAAVWVWFRGVEAWGNLISGWVEETGQKGRVLTLYELHSSDATAGLEFHGMPEEAMKLVLMSMQKRGKCNVFGEGGAEGVKIY